MKVLFVQETPFLATALKVTLQRLGFDLIVLENKLNPCATLRNIKPEMVITDITQPGGIDYVDEAKRKNLPVIVISANGKEGDLQKAFDKGADDYLSLPLSISELALRVNILSRGKHTLIA